MTVRITSWAFNAPVADPVERLLLIWLSEGCDMDGYVQRDPIKARTFCCTDDAGIRDAWNSLWIAGLIEMTDGTPRLAVDLEETAPREPKWVPSAALRAELLAAADGKCQACGSDDRLAIDHIVARTRGGSNERNNLQVLCIRCNSSKRDREGWAGRRA